MNANRNLAHRMTYNYTSKRYKDVLKQMEKDKENGKIKVTIPSK